MRMKKLSGQSRFPLAAPKASILIVALWSVALLSAFAVILNLQIRQYLVLAKRLEQKDKLRFIAQAGILKGALEIKNNPSKPYDWLGDSWSNNPAIFRGIEVGDGEFTLTSSRWDAQSSLKKINYGCVDEESKININKADQVTLARLFKAVLECDDQLAQELAACILDWRDADSELTTPLSAENFYYSGLSHPYAVKNSDFEVLDELLLVKGFDDNVFEKIKDYVTIYGEGKVNINTANAVVLFALGLDEDLASKIIAYRAGKDKLTGTSDDNIFISAPAIVPMLSQEYSLSPSQVEQLSLVAGSLGVSSNYFLAKVNARLNNRYILTASGVFKRNGKVLYWREN